MVEMVKLMVKNSMLITDVCLRTLSILRNTRLFTIAEMQYVGERIKEWTQLSESMLVNLDVLLNPASGVNLGAVDDSIRQWNDSLIQLAEAVTRFDVRFHELCATRINRPGISSEIEDLFTRPG